MLQTLTAKNKNATQIQRHTTQPINAWSASWCVNIAYHLLRHSPQSSKLPQHTNFASQTNWKLCVGIFMKWVSVSNAKGWLGWCKAWFWSSRNTFFGVLNHALLSSSVMHESWQKRTNCLRGFKVNLVFVGVCLGIMWFRLCLSWRRWISVLWLVRGESWQTFGVTASTEAKTPRVSSDFCQSLLKWNCWMWAFGSSQHVRCQWNHLWLAGYFCWSCI